MASHNGQTMDLPFAIKGTPILNLTQFGHSRPRLMAVY